ncbi:MAG: sensor hybrid histidine kinase, partial [Candidatus Krumholzibacteriota bacterium]|nr:sensor hybrid histidine kinase [Candidatus Krumholzibacteriota bacterium]
MSGSILIVDDDAKVREILEKSLVQKGHEVATACDGRGALSSCDDRVPDVVVLDLMLPDMDGRDVLKEIRSRPGGETVPVLFLSARSDLDTRAEALDGGAEDFLVKPFSLRELNAKIERVLGLFAVSQDLNSRLDLEDMINSLALSLVGELQAASMAFFEMNREGDAYLTLRELKGFDRKRIADLKIPAEGEFVRWVRESSKPRKIARNGDPRWAARLPDIRLAVFEYVTPIIVRQTLRGLVFTGPKLNGRECKPFELDLLASLCNSAGTAMEHGRLFQQLENTYLSTVKALMSIVEAKDAYTKGHTERVADYAAALGAKMLLGKNELRDLTFAAVLHDIGKLVIYENVLMKPG